MRVVFASHSAKVGVFRVGSHHYSRELALLGDDVVHVSTPVSAAHLVRMNQASVRQRAAASVRGPSVDEHGVTHLVPFVALPLARIAPAHRARALKPAARTIRRLLGGVDVLIIDQPLFAPLIDLLEPRVVVYRPTDAHPDVQLREAENRVLRRAHAIAATSQPVLDDVRTNYATTVPATVLENGVEFDHFAVPSEGREGVAYLGSLDRRFDWEAVEAFARALPDVAFRIAGPVPADAPRALPGNVELVGPVPYRRAPQFLAGAKIGLLPLSDDAGNAGRSPMKYYEYLAAGLFVVARSSEALRARSAPGVRLYDTIDDGVAALTAALADGHADNAAGRRAAEFYSWRGRAHDLRGFILENLPESAARPATTGRDR